MTFHNDDMRRMGRRWPWLAVTLALATTLLTSCAAASSTTGGSNPALGAAAPQATASPIPTATPIPANPTVRQTFEKGIAFPRWGTNVYGPTDPTWASDVASMRAQTHAQWVEIIVDLSQVGPSGTVVNPSGDTPTPDDIYVGVMNARAAGLKVYLKPLLHVEQSSSSWSGDVTFGSHAAAQQWFQSYWLAYKPYVEAAANAGASQVSIGTEFSLLQKEYPDQWEWLLQQVSGVFHGSITYELNHDTITGPEPSWLRDPQLTYVGVSMYTSLQATPKDISASQIERLWGQLVLPRLDQLSKTVGKPVILSEIGYRDTADCLYDPWTHTSSAPADPTLQGAAYTAALTETVGDPHVAGVFFWAWQNGIFSPSAPATQALSAAYGA